VYYGGEFRGFGQLLLSARCCCGCASRPDDGRSYFEDFVVAFGVRSFRPRVMAGHHFLVMPSPNALDGGLWEFGMFFVAADVDLRPSSSSAVSSRVRLCVAHDRRRKEPIKNASERMRAREKKTTTTITRTRQGAGVDDAVDCFFKNTQSHPATESAFFRFPARRYLGAIEHHYIIVFHIAE